MFVVEVMGAELRVQHRDGDAPRIPGFRLAIQTDCRLGFKGIHNRYAGAVGSPTESTTMVVFPTLRPPICGHKAYPQFFSIGPVLCVCLRCIILNISRIVSRGESYGEACAT